MRPAQCAVCTVPIYRTRTSKVQAPMKGGAGCAVRGGRRECAESHDSIVRPNPYEGAVNRRCEKKSKE